MTIKIFKPNENSFGTYHMKIMLKIFGSIHVVYLRITVQQEEIMMDK